MGEREVAREEGGEGGGGEGGGGEGGGGLGGEGGGTGTGTGGVGRAGLITRPPATTPPDPQLKIPRVMLFVVRFAVMDSRAALAPSRMIVNTVGVLVSTTMVTT